MSKASWVSLALPSESVEVSSIWVSLAAFKMCSKVKNWDETFVGTLPTQQLLKYFGLTGRGAHCCQKSMRSLVSLVVNP